MTKFLSTGLFTLLLACCASTGHTAETSVTTDGQKFAKAAANGGMMEVKAGELAEKQGGTQEIKAFGAMMVKDHTAAGDELKAIATKDGIKLPDSVTPKMQTKLDMLAKLNGAAFDKAYVPAMVEGHEKTLALMQAEAENGTDPDLKAFAEKTAKVVEMHLKHIKEIQASMK